MCTNTVSVFAISLSTQFNVKDIQRNEDPPQRSIVGAETSPSDDISAEEDRSAGVVEEREESAEKDAAPVPAAQVSTDGPGTHIVTKRNRNRNAW